MPSPIIEEEIEQSGFALIRAVMGDPDQRALLATLGEVAGAGRRGLLGLPAVAALARS